jgi:hypothetical protein
MRLFLLGALIAGAGCGQSKADLTPITQEDETLKKNEDDLVGQRGALQRERKKLLDERAELAEKRKAATDKAAAAALDDQEAALTKKETDLVSQEGELSKKLDTLLSQRSELIKKVTEVPGTAGANNPEERAAKRELGVAQREKELARREAEVAEREATIAVREKDLAKREKETCGVAPVAAAPKFELPKALKYGQHDVEPVYKKALKAMQEKGLVAADLGGSSRLVEDTRAAMTAGDYVRAKYDADQLLEEVQNVRVDRAFIAAKMARLSGAMKGKALDGEAKKQSDGLFQEATAAYGDGKFSQANQKINRIFSLLK